MPQPASSNDPSHMQESFEAAKQRLSRTVQGLDANEIGFFAETNRHKVSNSNDKDHIQNMIDTAKHKFKQ